MKGWRERAADVFTEQGSIAANMKSVPGPVPSDLSNVAGSVALFPDCFRRWVRLCGFPLHEAVKATGYNQLRSLGIADRGEIVPGQIADLVLVDDSLTPQTTIVGGTLAAQCA